MSRLPLRLWIEWCAYLLLSALFLAALHARLFPAIYASESVAQRWTLVVGMVLAVFAWRVLRLLPDNHRSDETTLLHSLGWGTAFTLTRLTLIAALTGFLLLGSYPREAAVLIALLYSAASLTDFIDGGLARLTRHSTRLGERLDMDADSLGVIAGSYLAVLFGKLPWPYLLFALARYIFLAALWLRRRRGLPVAAMGANPLRRVLAGVQMVFIPIAMFPHIHAQASLIVGWLLLTPFIGSFLYDYAHMAGWSSSDWYQPVKAFAATVRRAYPWLAVALRALAAVISAWLYCKHVDHNALLSAWLAITLAGMLFGVLPRLLSISILLFVGIVLGSLPAPALLAVVAAAAICIMVFGSGRLTLWVPESWFAETRVGDRA